jgi:hypothetical protein
MPIKSINSIILNGVGTKIKAQEVGALSLAHDRSLAQDNNGNAKSLEKFSVCFSNTPIFF